MPQEFLNIDINGQQTLALPEVTAIFEEIWEGLYPVGALYISTNNTPPTRGTWVPYAEGRVLIGAGTSDQTFVAGTEAGESNVLLTLAHMPSHTHPVSVTGTTGTESATHTHNSSGPGDHESTIRASYNVAATSNYNRPNNGGTTGSADSHMHAGFMSSLNIRYAGGPDAAHDNLPPYTTVFIFRRIA